MNHSQNTSWEQLASEFLNDCRMLQCHCSPEALELMMELGSRITGEAEHVYFLTHRDEQAALSELKQEATDCSWLKGLCILAAWRLGYPKPARQCLASALFDYPKLGLDLHDIPEKNGVHQYFLKQLKTEQKNALLQADLTKLRLFVDLAPKPKKMLKLLLMLAFKKKIPAAIKELVSWLPEYPDALNKQTLVTLLLNNLPNETQASFLAKLRHLEQHPLLKLLVNAAEFRTHWFMHLMSAGLMNARILKKMLTLGLPADTAINIYDKWWRLSDKNLLEDGEDNTRLPLLPDVMHLFRDLKPLVTPSTLEQLEREGGNWNYEFQQVLLFCELADAFAEWEKTQRRRL